MSSDRNGHASRTPIIVDSDPEDITVNRHRRSSRPRTSSSVRPEARIECNYPIVRKNYHTVDHLLKDLPDEDLPADADSLTLLSDKLEHLTCIICENLMPNARIWPCHHSFCRACTKSTFDGIYSELLEEERPPGPIDRPIIALCPICRHETKSFEPEPFIPIRLAVKFYLDTRRKVTHCIFFTVLLSPNLVIYNFFKATGSNKIDRMLCKRRHPH